MGKIVRCVSFALAVGALAGRPSSSDWIATDDETTTAKPTGDKEDAKGKGDGTGDKKTEDKKMRGKRREASWRKMTRRRPQSRQGTKKTPKARGTAQAIKRKKIQKGRKRREASWRKMTRRRPQSRQGTKKTP